MRGLAVRMAALEQRLGPGPEPSIDPPAFVRWWSTPVVFGVVLDRLFSIWWRRRGRRRD